MIRVFLIDDHAIVRAGLAALLANQKDMRCVGQAANGQEALPMVKDDKVEVALIDLEMPRCDGIKTIELLSESAPKVKTIALTMHQQRMHVESSLAAGASGFVAKHVADRELMKTIRKVASGSSFVSVVGDGEMDMATKQTSRRETLSAREKQVFEFLVLGHTNREIAELLNVGTKTVETYRARTSQKLGLRSRAELVQHAISTGLMQRLVSRFPGMT